MCLIGIYHPRLYDFFFKEDTRVINPKVQNVLKYVERGINTLKETPIPSVVCITAGLTVVGLIVYYTFVFTFRAVPLPPI